MKKIIAWLLFAAMVCGLAGCGGSNAVETTEVPETTETVGQLMDASGKYVLDKTRNEAIVDDAGVVTVANDGNARVYYQIFVGSFSDSNGDGIGDLRGIIDRFDYLNDGDDNSGLSLGVEGIWLSPIFTSPSYHKYDVMDYYEIDPKFGTMEDLKELIELCRSRNVQIILDLVINHSSKENAWFKQFCDARRQGDTANPYYDFYTCSPERTGSKTWQAIPGANCFYECNFSSHMPEMNFDNQDVRQAMVDVAKFYLDLGVDGFRFDAAKYIYFGEEPRNAEFWEWYMQQLRAIKPDIYTVAEVWDSDSVTYPYFTSTNCFNFSMSQINGRIAETAKAGNVNALMSYVETYLGDIHARNSEAMMVTFIANHDMDRAAGYLTVATGQAQVAANLSILMPGSSFIYYGEEIALPGSRGGANTDANRRLGMYWGDGDTVGDPEGSNYKAKTVNGSVTELLPNGNSLYNHYKKLIMIRKANPEIAYGTFTPLKTTSRVGGFLAEYEGKTVAVLHNTTQKEAKVDLAKITDVSLTTIAAYVGLGDAVLDGAVLTLAPQTSVVLR